MRDWEGPNTEVCLCVSQMEEEQDPEERDQFLQQLYKFMEDRGQLRVCAITGKQIGGKHLKPDVILFLFISSLDI